MNLESEAVSDTNFLRPDEAFGRQQPWMRYRDAVWDEALGETWDSLLQDADKGAELGGIALRLFRSRSGLGSSSGHYFVEASRRSG